MKCITFYAISVILLYYLILYRMSDISENLVHIHLTQLSWNVENLTSLKLFFYVECLMWKDAERFAANGNIIIIES